MKNATRRARLLTAAIVLGLGAAGSLVGTAPAGATTLVSSHTGQMVITGYDASVAAAHGFKVVHNADGTESSVPVTAAAKQAMASMTPSIRAQISRTASTDTVASPDATGNCGTDSLVIYAQPSTSGIVINTGYSVYSTSIGQVWHVIGRTPNTAYSEPFNGANLSTTWHATHVKHPLSGYGQGYGDIQTGSYALLLNGGTCSALPEGTEW